MLPPVLSKKMKRTIVMKMTCTNHQPKYPKTTVLQEFTGPQWTRSVLNKEFGQEYLYIWTGRRGIRYKGLNPGKEEIEDFLNKQGTPESLKYLGSKKWKRQQLGVRCTTQDASYARKFRRSYQQNAFWWRLNAESSIKCTFWSATTTFPDNFLRVYDNACITLPVAFLSATQ